MDLESSVGNLGGINGLSLIRGKTQKRSDAELAAAVSLIDLHDSHKTNSVSPETSNMLLNLEVNNNSIHINTQSYFDHDGLKPYNVVQNAHDESEEVDIGGDTDSENERAAGDIFEPTRSDQNSVPEHHQCHVHITNPNFRPPSARSGISGIRNKSSLSNDELGLEREQDAEALLKAARRQKIRPESHSLKTFALDQSLQLGDNAVDNLAMDISMDNSMLFADNSMKLNQLVMSRTTAFSNQQMAELIGRGHQEKRETTSTSSGPSEADMLLLKELMLKQNQSQNHNAASANHSLGLPSSNTSEILGHLTSEQISPRGGPSHSSYNPSLKAVISPNSGIAGSGSLYGPASHLVGSNPAKRYRTISANPRLSLDHLESSYGADLVNTHKLPGSGASLNAGAIVNLQDQIQKVTLASSNSRVPWPRELYPSHKTLKIQKTSSAGGKMRSVDLPSSHKLYGGQHSSSVFSPMGASHGSQRNREVAMASDSFPKSRSFGIDSQDNNVRVNVTNGQAGSSQTQGSCSGSFGLPSGCQIGTINGNVITGNIINNINCQSVTNNVNVNQISLADPNQINLISQNFDKSKSSILTGFNQCEGWVPGTTIVTPNGTVKKSGVKPGPVHRKRGETKKCRKVYGIERKTEWCKACIWKKACNRFPD